MDLVSLILTIAFAGLIVWAVTTLVPMPAEFKKAIYVLAVVGLVFYVLSGLGLVSRVGLH